MIASSGQLRAARSQSVTGPIHGGWLRSSASWKPSRSAQATTMPSSSRSCCRSLAQRQPREACNALADGRTEGVGGIDDMGAALFPSTMRSRGARWTTGCVCRKNPPYARSGPLPCGARFTPCATCAAHKRWITLAFHPPLCRIGQIGSEVRRLDSRGTLAEAVDQARCYVEDCGKSAQFRALCQASNVRSGTQLWISQPWIESTSRSLHPPAPHKIAARTIRAAIVLSKRYA